LHFACVSGILYEELKPGKRGNAQEYDGISFFAGKITKKHMEET